MTGNPAVSQVRLIGRELVRRELTVRPTREPFRLRGVAAAPVATEAIDRERPRRWTMPSWFTSIWIHGLLIAVALFLMQGWHGLGHRGEATGDSRLTGLVTQLDDGSTETDAPPGEINISAAEIETTFPTSDLPTADLTTDDLPPLDSPNAAGLDLPPVDGPGPAASAYAAAPPAAPAAAGGGSSSGPAPAAGLARGETSFLGVRDAGETFVYVIDISGSMEESGAIRVAKEQLMQSLEPLGSSQRFQVIFYNERALPLLLPGRAPAKLYDASALNKSLARQVIASVQANLGTQHLTALELALSIQPDVIFFLTDADDPALTGKDLDLVRKANPGGTRIHAIEFGKGAKLDASRSLERLAAQNHGAYQYRDITTFRR